MNKLPAKTPAGNEFKLPTAALTEAIAAEWRAQGPKVKPETMPLTQLAATTLDITASKRDEIVANLAAYATSDLLCHRAETPPELAERQAKIWQPWLDWAERKYGATLCLAKGIMPVPQPNESLLAFREAVAAFDDFGLTGLQQAVGTTGSLILGLALASGKANVDDIYNAAELDCLFQMEQWGEDPATEERLKKVRKELEACATWFRLLGKPAA